MRVAKWGNSLAVRLPKRLVEELGLACGDELAIVAAGKSEFAIVKSDARGAALDRMAARGWTAPAGFRFDREEANARDAEHGADRGADQGAMGPRRD